MKEVQRQEGRKNEKRKSKNMERKDRFACTDGIFSDWQTLQAFKPKGVSVVWGKYDCSL